MTIFTYIRLSLSAFAFNLLLSHALADCTGETQYTVTFRFEWTTAVDTGIPNDPNQDVGFANILCLSHNSNYSLWREGQVTSADLNRILIDSDEEPLKKSIRDKTSLIADSFFLDNVEAVANKSDNITFKGKGGFTLLSCFANIEPSPGWFVGVDSIQLCKSGADGDSFISSESAFDLKGFNAGLYSNEAYVNENLDSVSPPAAVRHLLGFADSYGKLNVKSPNHREPTPHASCFPADERIALPHGESIPVNALTTSHVVLSQHANATSPVFMFSHRDPDTVSRFVHLHFRHGNVFNSLRISPGHYIYRFKFWRADSAIPEDHGNTELVMASCLRPGDALIGADGRPRLIERISSTLARGLYNPHSLHGDLIVSGVRVSSYTSAVPPHVASGALTPVRLLYRLGLHSLSHLLSMYMLRGEWNQWLHDLFCLRW